MPVSIGGNGPITGVTSINTTVTDTELGYLDGVSSALQTQINGKLTTPGAWTAFTPTWGAGFTPGNANITFVYTQIGKAVIVRGRATFGSTTSVPGFIDMELPLAAASSLGGFIPLGNAYYFDNTGAATLYIGNPIFLSQTGKGYIRFVTGRADSTYLFHAEVTGGVPFTWVANDELYTQFIYEAA